MPDYDLTRLGSRAFEQMVVALARKELGPGVQVFGDGPDGGRDATFDGTVDWSATSVGITDRTDTWSGYTVLQSKFQVKPKPEPHDNAVWLQGQINSEITTWARAANERTRARLPEYLVFITNADLSSVAKTGGIDTLTSFIATKLAPDSEAAKSGLQVRGFTIWHADQIRSMLDAHQDVRWAFPGLLTVGDVLAMLNTGVVSLGSMDLQDPLREELLRSLKADRWIRLSQAGGPGDAKLWLDDIAIDLPATVEEEDVPTVQTVRHVLQLGDTVLRQRQPDRIARPNLVIVGGPGQGKSTLSQLIAQSYRVAMLTDANLAPAAEEIVTGTCMALVRIGLPVPTNRRWPVRIDLAKYAEELSTGADITLLRWISTQISKRTEQDISPARLREWLRTWPWALILDGLDEVPSLSSRRLLYHQIDDLLTTAEDLDADLLLVVTTRPTGYDERFPAGSFQHLQLQRLPAGTATTFSRRITDKRFVEDDEMRTKVADRMLEASRDPITARLMETPLQVTIMSFIVEKYPTLPPDRFTLFDLYYRTVCEREVAKDIPIARFLSENRARIDRLHEQVGLTLQVESEEAKGAEAALSSEALGELAAAQLRERGFEANTAVTYAAKLVEAATHRLVLLTPRDGGVGFEIRSLQELMAARSLSEGDDAEVMSRLRLIAHNPHWRNTWLLAAGNILLSSERFEKTIIDLLKRLDTDPQRLNARFPTAPSLAADILEDNLAARRPNFERALVQRVFAALDRPPVVDLARLAQALLRITSTSYRPVTFERLASAAAAGLARRAAAALVLHEMSSATQDNGRLTSIRITLQKLALSEPEADAVAAWGSVTRGRCQSADNATDLVEYLESLLGSIGLDDDGLQLLRDGLKSLARSQYRLTDNEPGTVVPLHLDASDVTPLLRALEREDEAVSLDLALETLPSSHWAIEAMLGAAIKPAQNREPVGRKLFDSIRAARTHESNFADL